MDETSHERRWISILGVYVLCYVDALLAISDNPTRIMKRIQSKFSLKGDKMEKPENYLGVYMSEMYNADGNLCWAMSSDKYCQALVENVDSLLVYLLHSYFLMHFLLPQNGPAMLSSIYAHHKTEGCSHSNHETGVQ